LFQIPKYLGTAPDVRKYLLPGVGLLIPDIAKLKRENPNLVKAMAATLG